MAALLQQVSRWMRSLQAQLLLWAILPLTLVIIGLSLTGVYTHQQAMRDFTVQRDLLLARVLATNLQDALRHGTVSADGSGVDHWLPVRHGDLAGDVLVVDIDGRILAASNAPVAPGDSVANSSDASWLDTAFSQMEGATVIYDMAAEPVIVSFAAPAGTNWRVVVRSRVGDLLGPILRFSRLGPIAAIAAGAVSLLVLIFGWRTIAQPLQTLSTAAAAVSGGDQTSIQHEEISGVAEIEDLHEAIKSMVGRLESYQAGVLDYLNAMSRGQEEERARLARELHDGPVQSLIALTQRTERAEQQLRQGQLEATQAMLVQLRDAEVATVSDLRRIIGALRPAYLEDLGFVPALEMLVQSADARGDADVRLIIQDDQRLSADIELAAYRIAQEALNNAVQHSEADTITVSVRCSDEGVLLQVQDDGRGFTPAEHLDTYTRDGHFGLVGLQERARQLGGSLRIESAPGDGTVVWVSLPAAEHPPVRSQSTGSGLTVGQA